MIKTGEIVELDDTYAYVEWSFPKSVDGSVQDIPISKFPSPPAPACGQKVQADTAKGLIKWIRYI